MNIYEITIIVLFAIITFFSSFKTVQTGYTGVITRFGEYVRVTDNGVVWKTPYIDKIKKVNNKIQTVEYSGQVWSESSEQTPVYFESISIDYQILPEASLYMLSVSDNIKECLSASLVSSAIKSASVQIETKNVTNRSYIEPAALIEMQNAVNQKYGKDKIVVLKVSIGNADFETSYQNAILERQNAEIARQTAITTNETALEKAEVEKEIAIKKAETESETKIIEATAEADALKIKTEAEVEAIKTKAKAEAEANRDLAQSYNENVLTHEYYEAWDGKLPTTVIGETSDNLLFDFK